MTARPALHRVRAARLHHPASAIPLWSRNTAIAIKAAVRPDLVVRDIEHPPFLWVSRTPNRLLRPLICLPGVSGCRFMTLGVTDFCTKTCAKSNGGRHIQANKGNFFKKVVRFRPLGDTYISRRGRNSIRSGGVCTVPLHPSQQMTG